MINEGIVVENSLGLYVIFSVFTLLIGVMFIGGFWRGKWSLMSGSTIDKVMLRSIKDKRIFRSGDQLVFMVFLLMSLCILTNGVLEYIIPETPNVSAIFLFVAFFCPGQFGLFLYSLTAIKDMKICLGYGHSQEHRNDILLVAWS